MIVDDLLRYATEATGRTDFGDDELFGGDGWREGLRRLVDSFNAEAALHDLGRVVVQGELVTYLSNRLRIVGHHREQPQIRDRDVTPPVIIIGQARTGTTMLFDLLAQDPAHRVPLTWEVDRPLPPPRTETYDTDPRIAETEATFALVDSIIPEFRSVHQLGAQLAQECLRMTASAFISPIFPTQYEVPSYLDWLLHDAVEDGYIAAAYTWHRRFLEILQSEHSGQRWLLKSPSHTWMLPQLLREYPDALLVQTHRDPARVMASTTSLVAMLRRLGTDRIEPDSIATEFSELILDGLERSTEARLDGTIASDRVVDVQFDAMMREPMRCVEAVYAGFGWELSTLARERMELFLRGNSRESHGGGHHYTFADTGLDLAAVRARTARYAKHFDVPNESC
ncbi:sulfotransferase family protein [Nocardia tengchongensis]|uniref:sulfotransferase family protein n=1 Tax=Nocardia tengchongensis TaxID=2055889 RepID=UPI0036766240